jgi:hypothetical protein
VTVTKTDDAKYINQYEVIRDLGKGSFGKVCIIFHASYLPAYLPTCSLPAYSLRPATGDVGIQGEGVNTIEGGGG